MKRKNEKDESVYPEKILHRAKVLTLVIKKKITQSQAAKELKLRSDRQIRKLLNPSLTADVAIPYQIRISFFNLSPQVLLLLVGCGLERLVFC